MSNHSGVKELRSRFAIPGLVDFEQSASSLVRMNLTTPFADAHIYLQGAHVTHYQPRDQRPVLFMSGRSMLEPQKPIRGGIPVIFPWFGPATAGGGLPLHGFVRQLPWTIHSVKQSHVGGVAAVFQLSADAQTLAIWPHDFELHCRVVVGPELDISLLVANRSTAPFQFSEALHTYLSVGDVRQCTVEGLEGTSFIDKTDEMKRKAQGHVPVHIAAETDRLYLGTRATCVVNDPVFGRQLSVEKHGSQATVVWNPWAAKSKSLPDFGDDEWRGMLCVETANAADHELTLEPGQTHEMRAVIRSDQVS